MKINKFKEYALEMKKDEKASMVHVRDGWQELEKQAKSIQQIPFYIKTFLSAVTVSITNILENKEQKPITLILFQGETEAKNVTRDFKSGIEALEHLFHGGVYRYKTPTYSYHYFNLDDFVDYFKKAYEQYLPGLLDLIRPSLLLCNHTEYCLTPIQVEFLTKQIKVDIIKYNPGWNIEQIKSSYESELEWSLPHINKYLRNSGEPIIHCMSREEGGVVNLVISNNHHKYLKQILNNLTTHISDWERLESRKQTKDFIQAIPELKFIPEVLAKIIYGYLDIMITEEEIKELYDLNQELKMKKIPRYMEMSTQPNVLHILSELLLSLYIKMPARVSYDDYNPHSDDTNYTLYYDPTQGLAQLLNGVMVGYGTAKELLHRFAQSSSQNQKMFSLLKFLKDFRIASNIPPEARILVQKLLTGIIKLAETHQYLELTQQESSSLAQKTGVSSITSKSDLQAIHHFEESLNRFLKEQKCEADAIDYVTVNEHSTVTLYVKSAALQVTRTLSTLFDSPNNLSNIWVHFSPAAYYQFMLQGGTLQNVLGTTQLDSRRQCLQRSLANLHCDSKSLFSFKEHDFYGYRACVSQTLFNQINELKFIPNILGVKDQVLKVVNHLQPYLNKRWFIGDSATKRDILQGLIKEYTDVSDVLFVPKLDKCDELERGIKLLKEWETALGTCLAKNAKLFVEGYARDCINASLKWAGITIQGFELTLKKLNSGELRCSY